MRPISITDTVKSLIFVRVLIMRTILKQIYCLHPELDKTASKMLILKIQSCMSSRGRHLTELALILYNFTAQKSSQLSFLHCSRHFDTTRFPSSAQVTHRIEILRDEKNMAAPMVAAIFIHDFHHLRRIEILRDEKT
jgi:hypothetical protein